MRLAAPASLLVFAALLAGCLPVPSLHPFIARGDGVSAPQFVGEWGSPGETVTIARLDSIRYTLAVTDTAGTSLTFVLCFGRIAGRWFADARLADSESPEGDLRPFRWPMHVLLRADAAGDSLRLCALDDDALARRMREGRVRVRHEDTPDGLVLTEGTRGLRRLLARVAADDDAFQPLIDWQHRR